MYNHYFGLISSPFAIAPDPGYLYMSAQHRDALAHLLYGIQGNSGFVMLTGEIGTGKTTLCRCMLGHIPQDTEVAFILNPTLSSEELLASICDELQIPYDQQNQSIKSLSDAIYHHLLQSHSEGKNTILIIDEAQNLSPTVLEQMRLLTNLETNEKKLLQIVMFGQPELRQLVERPELKQLAQRITARFHLTALTLDETEHYINHRLAVAGYKPRAQTSNPIPANRVRQIHQLSGGIPRLINILCDRALLGAYARNEPSISAEILNQAAKEIFGKPQTEPKSSNTGANTLTLVLGVIFIALLIYRFYPAAQQWLTDTVPALTNAGPLHAATEPETPNPTAAQATVAPELPSPAAMTTTESDTSYPDTSLPASSAALATNLTETAPDAPDPVTSPQNNEPRMQTVNIAPLAQPDQVPESHTNPAEPAPVLSATGPQQNQTTSTVSIEISDNPEVRAYQSLFRLWQLEMPADQDPCQFALNHGLRCLHKQGPWQQLQRNNRPALVRLPGKPGTRTSQILVRIDSDTASFTDGIRTWKTPLSQLDDMSPFNYTLLWHPPRGYHTLTRPGSYGPHILWVKQQLAQLSPLFQSEMNDYFDDQLTLYIKAFQRSQNLLQDGIMGPETLIRLNTLVEANIPLILSYREP
ncbi:general secretion pathway protein A [Amphritea atlantica]|uniref:General secretion pathway protein A n=1 Tax=Amphritea atlantica TaxID=355243 RepID=A0A1H9GPJ3_9GAMM|nr:ExeA family protein [Amphritea atlantica]SEQ51909.1 general secretion pathway protein A [Amphritea atlantica]